MKLLLDTRAFYWSCPDDPALSMTACSAIADIQNEKYVSAITAGEFITKFRSGGEPGFSSIAASVSGAVAAQGLTELPITMRRAEVGAGFPIHHKDPMDRRLIAQEIVDYMTIVTMGRICGSYAAKIMW